jgi:transcriptional regulator with XRE-family HTH domain
MLVDRRHRARLTQAQVAARVGWRQKAISKRETGSSHRLTVIASVLLSEAMGFDPLSVARRVKATPDEE